LLFDDDQAVALAVALQIATTGAGIEEAAARALNTVRQVMPARLRRRVETLQVTAVERPVARPHPQVDSSVLMTLGDAVHAREVLRFDYTPASPAGTGDGDSAEAPPRRVQPHHLVTWGGRWYLVAWDLDREDWRTFRADRITSPQITGPRFTPRDPPGGDPAAYVSQSVSTTPYRYQARIRLHVPASAVAERLPPTVGHLQADGEHACILHTGADSPDVLAIYVAILGAEFEILDPPELAEHVLALASRLTRAARH
jgi:predicted DNA-binding transcriptional regulator YafY